MRYRYKIIAFTIIIAVAMLALNFDSSLIQSEVTGMKAADGTESETNVIRDEGQQELLEKVNEHETPSPETPSPETPSPETEVNVEMNPEEELLEQSESADVEFAESSNKAEPVPIEKEPMGDIVKTYEQDFDKMKVEAETKINNLIEKAKEEYYSVEEENRSMVFKLELMNKYLKAGNDLEESFDKKFYEILSELEAELSLNEYDTSDLKEIEDVYITGKRERRKVLISKAMGKM